jgi:hypothetical protein
MGSVSEARARQRINTLTSCQGIRDGFSQGGSSLTEDKDTHILSVIRDGFGQRGSSSTEGQHTHKLSKDQGRVRSARFKLDRGSRHSQAVKGSGTRLVS